MKIAVCSLSLLVVSTFGVGPQDKDQPKEEGIKCEMEYMEYLDKTWGIKCKSVTLDSSSGKLKLKLLMEFTKDVSDLKAMREALSPLRPGRNREPTFYFHYFDTANVQIAKMPVERLEGELSGKKGDAFRLYLPWGKAYERTVKIDGRPEEKKEPAKDKPKTDKPKDT
jgi:hypothetical protein